MRTSFKLFICFSILLVVGASFASAQVVFRKGGDVVLKQAPPVETGIDRNAVMGSVSGTISWSTRTIGLPPMYPGAPDPYAVPCGLLVVLAKKNVGVPGGFGQQEVVGRANTRPVEQPRRGTYACEFTVQGLPKDTGLTLTVEFLDSRTFDTEPWISPIVGSGRTAPPTGYERVFTGDNGAFLTNERPRGEVHFGIGYAPKPEVPR